MTGRRGFVQMAAQSGVVLMAAVDCRAPAGARELPPPTDLRGMLADARHAETRSLMSRYAQEGTPVPMLTDGDVTPFSYNDHALTRLRETLKDAIDPNGILAAGRYGVWPKHLRREQT